MAAQSWIRGRLLGAGAFGSVNLAINREDGEVFAVKSVQVHERDAGSEVAVRAIENEIRVLQDLDSRYIVRCWGSDWTEESGQLMRNVFLEYMPEGCLTDFVKQFASSGALDEHLLRTYTRSVVEGIDYLHSLGIVHCDIKGKNILVGNGNVKLTDFGSAKRVGGAMEMAEGDVMNCSAKVNGTPLWMAPEVVRQVEQGPASDIWSLGCTVVELATGRAPWSNLAGNHFVALYHIGCTDELPAVPASLSAEAHDFLSHCFQRDPRRRWTSAQLLQHPFLTTRFVAAAPMSLKAPSSPISVIQFPADSDSDLSATFLNSVPTLAAPSLFKRGLVSAQPKVQEQVEENCWSATPASPDSGPWIVVRSPKSASSPPSFALSDWMTPVLDTPPPSVETPIASHDGEDTDTNCEVSEILAEQSPAISVSATTPLQSFLSCLEEAFVAVEAVVGTSDADHNSSPVEITTAVDTCHFAIALKLRERAAGNYARLSVLERFQFFFEDETPGTNLNLGFSILIGTINEYSERVYQYSNPQILLYWWQRQFRNSFQCSISDSDTYRKCCGHSDQCIIQLPGFWSRRFAPPVLAH